MQSAEVEKLRATLQSALDALPPKPKKAPEWLGSLTRDAHVRLCREIEVKDGPHLAARWCLHALNERNPALARQHLEDAAAHIARALAELEGC